MTNILLNYYNFDGDWARPHLQKYLAPHPKALILPLAFRDSQATDSDSWLSVYGKGGEKYPNIVRPFLAYGYTEEDLQWLNPYRAPDALAQVQGAQLLFFTGGMPERAIAWLQKLGLTEAVKRFDGIVAGASAGAMLQLAQYHITPDEDYAQFGMWQGLGLVSGLDLEVHYLDTPLQRQCSAVAHAQHGLPVYKMWHEGGLIVDSGTITIMGQVEV